MDDDTFGAALYRVSLATAIVLVPILLSYVATPEGSFVPVAFSIWFMIGWVIVGRLTHSNDGHRKFSCFLAQYSDYHVASLVTFGWLWPIGLPSYLRFLREYR